MIRTRRKVAGLSMATLLILVVLGVVVFGVARRGQAEDRLNVCTVNYPLKYFAERIGGETVNVTFPVPRDVDPAYWEPDIQVIAVFQQADLILLNGAGYAHWINKVSLPHSRMVDTSKAFREKLIAAQHGINHSHGPKGEHAHKAMAFTIWLDFDLAVQQADAIAKAFSRKRPDQRMEYGERFQALKADLDKLSDTLDAMTTQAIDHPMIASHPVYDYLARRFRLNLASVHWEPNEAPATEQWRELKALIKTHPAQWMVWEGEPLPETERKLNALGMGSLVFDPCGNTPDRGHFLSVMQQNILNLKPVFQ